MDCLYNGILIGFLVNDCFRKLNVDCDCSFSSSYGEFMHFILITLQRILVFTLFVCLISEVQFLDCTLD